MLYYTFRIVRLLFYIYFFERRLISTLFLGWGYQPIWVQAGIYLLFYTLFAFLPLLVGTLFIYNSLGSFCLFLLCGFVWWQAVQCSPLFQFAEKRGPQRCWKVLVQCTAAINGFLSICRHTSYLINTLFIAHSSSAGETEDKYILNPFLQTVFSARIITIFLYFQTSPRSKNATVHMWQMWRIHSPDYYSVTTGIL